MAALAQTALRTLCAAYRTDVRRKFQSNFAGTRNRIPAALFAGGAGDPMSAILGYFSETLTFLFAAEELDISQRQHRLHVLSSNGSHVFPNRWSVSLWKHVLQYLKFKWSIFALQPNLFPKFPMSNVSVSDDLSGRSARYPSKPICTNSFFLTRHSMRRFPFLASWFLRGSNPRLVSYSTSKNQPLSSAYEILRWRCLQDPGR